MLEIITKAKLDERVLDSFHIIGKNKVFFANLGLTSQLTSETFTYYDRNKNYMEVMINQIHIDAWEKKFKMILNNFIPSDSTIFLAGGSVLTYILYGNEMLIRDFDFFVPTAEEFEKLDAHLKKLSPTNIVENENTRHFTFKSIEIDVIKKPSPSLKELLARFDIDICQVGFEINNGTWRFEKNVTFQKIFERQFNIPNLSAVDFKTMGIKLLRRIIKYTKKGYSPSYSCIINFFASTILQSSNKKIGDVEFDVMTKELEAQIKKDYQFIDDKLEEDGDDLIMASGALPTMASGPVYITSPIPTVTSSTRKGSGSWISLS